MWAAKLIVVTLLLLQFAALALSCSCGEEAKLECGCTKHH
uniref:Gonadal protein gdl-ORF39 n=2 Tax=Drosophila melanogaster TaxID=7227 RepID=GDLO_DROME|nr:gdl-ORF39 [Drosophila melanogaster]Q9U5V6.1 RecName: Full=Gonadal protein gdl-ORF39 [Drosophila melanogaster]AAO41249.1 gdl-ORF39 [Drosophila melanogaster]AGK45241.1 IP10311p1 [Drosophila melanogaster]CAB58350.1 gdl-ORF39 [Drosophila melanogaster]|eukprot:NP_001027126.1 gdl-ORF39 [Drosophila melanogaster]